MMKKMSKILILVWVLLLLPSWALAAAPSEVITGQDRLVGVAEQIGNVESFGNFCILQGGCATEDFAWFIMLDKTTAQAYAATKSCVVKYDMKTMEKISTSDVLKLGHGNDITYLPETNEICVIHVSGKWISLLDADTLAFKERRKLPVDGYAIAYQPERKEYVVAYGELGMFSTNDQLKVLQFTGTMETTLVTQGICADEKYIYHVLWSSPSNVTEPDNTILVFDWEGNEITRIPIGLKDYEPENISIVGDDFIIACNNLKDDGQAIFRVRCEAQH